MDDMLTFISKRTKTIDNLSVKDVIAACQLTKSKFYRCVAEPFRFTDAQLDTIANLLRLSDGDRQQLFQYKHTIKTGEKPGYHDYLKNMILGIYAFEDDRSTKPFILYGPTNNPSSVGGYSASNLIDFLQNKLVNTVPENGRYPLEITIFNTYEVSKAKTIQTLLKNILKLDAINQFFDVTSNHFINSSGISIDKQFYAFYNLYSLIGIGDYDIHFANMDDTILGTTDSALIQYINRDKQNAFILIHITGGVTAVYTFEDNSLADFLLSNFHEHPGTHYYKRVPVSNPIASNTMLRETSEKYSKLMITFELCFENFVQDLWDDTTSFLQSNPYVIPQLRKHADPKNSLIGYGDNQFIEVLFSGFAARGQTNEQKEAISVIAATGLRDFAKNGATSEMHGTGIALSVDQRIKQLQFIKSRLGSAAKTKQQSFYLIDPMYNIPKRTFMVFKDHRIAISYQEDIHIDYTWKILEEEFMATLFYEYVDQELLSVENREQFGSVVMSDARAAVYIDDLIAKLRTDATSL